MLRSLPGFRSCTLFCTALLVTIGACSSDDDTDSSPQAATASPDASRTEPDGAAASGPDGATADAATGRPDAGPDAGSPVAGGGSGGAASIPAPPELSGPCTSDADCGGQLTCVTHIDDDGRAVQQPGGICTAECTDDPSVCTALGAGSICPLKRPLGTDELYCARTCEYGSADPNKCGGRQDMACTSLFDSAGARGRACAADADCPTGEVCDHTGFCAVRMDVCLPQCNSDAQCAEGFMCSGGYTPNGAGYCIADPPGMLPDTETGSFCAAPLACRGACISGVCADGCTIGAQDACSGTAGAICVGSESGAAAGDSGLCALPCTCNDDCPARDVFCGKLTETQAQELRIQSAGLCVGVGSGSWEPIPCGSGGSAP